MLAEVGREFVNRALSPIAARLPGLHPNVLTACGLFASVLAGIAFYLTDRHPGFFLVAGLLGVVYGLLDALDGVVARMHGKATAFGDFFDHSFDRLSALCALGGLAAARHTDDRLILLLMLGTLWHAYLGTQLQASFGSRVYQGIGIAESIVVALAYCVTAFTVELLGLPFHVTEPLTGATLSVSDIFALLSIPLVLVASVQRFVIAHALGRERDGARSGRTAYAARPRLEPGGVASSEVNP